MNPLLAQLTHQPFPEVAEAIRTRADQITRLWDIAVRKAMPQMRNLTFDELKDSTPQILLAIAVAIASEDPDEIRELLKRAPSQGLSRLNLNFDVVEVMQEDRLLRSIIVQQVENYLGRQMLALESQALHAAIDVMLQQSVVALVDQQKFQLRAAAETELKFLSFLSHDMVNNLGGVLLSLNSLSLDLKDSGAFPQAEESLIEAQQSIHNTVAGMRKMLDHERTRKSQNKPSMSAVDLWAMATRVVGQSQAAADAKGLKIIIEIIPGTVIESDEELLSLVLQNLLGNAVKYSSAGTIRVGSEYDGITDRRAIWLSDEGPGIAADQLPNIFEAFKRGEVHGQIGLGLGLAIASQAAKLLCAELNVQSEVQSGATFILRLPAGPRIGNGIAQRRTVTFQNSEPLLSGQSIL